MSSKLLKLPDVIDRVGMAKSSIYRAMRDGEFPNPVSIGPGAVAWLESELDEWIGARIADRDQRLHSRKPSASANSSSA